MAVNKFNKNSIEFGYYPFHLNIETDKLSLESLPDIDEKIKYVSSSPNIYKGWIYNGVEDLSQRKHFNIPRIFCLPKTHKVSIHEDIDNEFLEFVLWSFSFVIGIRLTTKEAGFIDSTPINNKNFRVIDFIIPNINKVFNYIFDFPKRYFINEAEKGKNIKSKEVLAQKKISAIINVFFFSKNPKNLNFERFNYIYIAFDAIYNLMDHLSFFKEGNRKNKHIPHSGRIKIMCEKLNIDKNSIPAWAIDRNSKISKIRNDMIHEGIFNNDILGFSIYHHQILEKGGFTDELLEMEKLLQRMIFALLIKPDSKYIMSSILDRQISFIDDL